MNEIWKDIKGYEGLYQVSNTGKVKSLILYSGMRGRILKTDKDKSGYYRVTLSKSSKITRFLVHRLVASAFCKN
jgi:hypothetical protein